MRPTLRAFWLILMAVPIAILLLAFSPSNSVLSLYYLVAVFVLFMLDWKACLAAKYVNVRIEEPSAIYIGDEAVLEVFVGAPEGRALYGFEVALEVNDLLEQAAQQPIKLEDGAGQLEVPLKPVSRGTARVNRVWFRWGGPLGLVHRQIEDALNLEIPVLPNFHKAATEAELALGSASQNFGFRPDFNRGQGSEFASMRDYAVGMDPRSIDWKRSARNYSLLSKEYEAERNHHIILAFDTGHLMAERIGGLSRLDHMVNAGLGLAYNALKGGDQVGLFAFDSQVRTLVKPIGGMTAFNHIQLHLAAIENSHTETNYTLAMTRLSENLSRRTLVVLFTDFVDTTTAELMRENLGRLATHHFVVFVAMKDPFLSLVADGEINSVKDISRSVTAAELLKERKLLFTRLRRQGVLCLEPDHAHLVGQVIGQYRSIINQELI
jgi:uncharacterized protein (DUF58 family)